MVYPVQVRTVRRGLSLMEIIVSMFVLGMVMIALFNLYPTSVLAVRRAEQQILANSVARSIVDRSLAGPYSALEVDTTTDLPAEVREGTTFTPTVAVFDVPGQDVNLIKRLRVTVTWEERGVQKEVVHEVLVTSLRD